MHQRGSIGSIVIWGRRVWFVLSELVTTYRQDAARNWVDTAPGANRGASFVVTRLKTLAPLVAAPARAGCARLRWIAYSPERTESQPHCSVVLRGPCNAVARSSSRLSLSIGQDLIILSQV